MAFETLCDIAIRLDTILTGRHEADTARNALEQSYLLDDPVAFVSSGQSYRLSDGGVSGVVVKSDGTLVLTAGSCPKIRETWKSKEACDQVELFRGAVMKLVERHTSAMAPGILMAARGVVAGR